MGIVGGLDIHRRQITFDYLDERSGETRHGRIAPADRMLLRGWLQKLVADTKTDAGTSAAPRAVCRRNRCCASGSVRPGGDARPWPLRCFVQPDALSAGGYAGYSGADVAFLAGGAFAGGADCGGGGDGGGGGC
jgi:hypothetical protein